MTPGEPTSLPEPVRAGIRHFQAGRWYEAHEAWEEYWLTLGGSRAAFYKGLIQAAVALHHWSHGNAQGARKLARSARRYLDPFRPAFEGIDVEDFLARMRTCFQPLEDALAAGKPAPKYRAGAICSGFRGHPTIES